MMTTSMHRNLERLTAGAIALAAAILLPASPALAQDDAPAIDPQPIVEQCLGQLRAVTARTVEGLGNAAKTGVGAVRELEAQGAPAPVIIQAGQRAKSATAQIAREGLRAADRITAQCVQKLREIDAPPRAFEAVLRANRASGQTMIRAQTHAQHAIGRAVRIALSDDDDPAPEGVAVTTEAIGAGEPLAAAAQ